MSLARQDCFGTYGGRGPCFSARYSYLALSSSSSAMGLPLIFARPLNLVMSRTGRRLAADLGVGFGCDDFMIVAQTSAHILPKISGVRRRNWRVDFEESEAA